MRNPLLDHHPHAAIFLLPLTVFGCQGFVQDHFQFILRYILGISRVHFLDNPKLKRNSQYMSWIIGSKLSWVELHSLRLLIFSHPIPLLQLPLVVTSTTLLPISYGGHQELCLFLSNGIVLIFYHWSDP